MTWRHWNEALWGIGRFVSNYRSVDSGFLVSDVREEGILGVGWFWGDRGKMMRVRLLGCITMEVIESMCELSRTMRDADQTSPVATEASQLTAGRPVSRPQEVPRLQGYAET